MAEPPKFARVTSIRELTPSVRQIGLAMVEPKELEYEAGQTIVLYAGFRDGKEIKRQYTLASAPHEEELMLCVKLIPGGAASSYLSSLKEGDQVTFSGPKGKCTLSKGGQEEDLLFCATGTGLAPVRGMLLSYFAKAKKPSVWQRLFGSGPKVRLLWGLRAREDIFWQEEVLENLARKHPAFGYEITLTQASDDWPGARGRLTERLVSTLKTLKKPRVFLIGNGAMIKDARKILEGEGVPKDSVETEAFFTPKARGMP